MARASKWQCRPLREPDLDLRAAAEAWNEYTETVARTPEPKQDEIVQRLRSALAEVGVLAGSPDSSFWDVLPEQADHGLL